MKPFGPKQKATPVDQPSGQTQKVKADMDDMVFEGRNKSYGAYENRKEDGIRHFNAILFGGLIFAGIIWAFSVIDLDPVEQDEAHSAGLSLITIDDGSGKKQQLKTVNYNGDDEVSGFKGVAQGGYDLPVAVSTEASILNLSGDDARAWEQAYNLSEGKKMVANLRLPEPIEVADNRGSLDLKVWVDKTGRIDNYELPKEVTQDLELALAKSLIGQQLPPVTINGEAKKALLNLSLHYGI